MPWTTHRPIPTAARLLILATLLPTLSLTACGGEGELGALGWVRFDSTLGGHMSRTPFAVGAAFGVRVDQARNCNMGNPLATCDNLSRPRLESTDPDVIDVVEQGRAVDTEPYQVVAKAPGTAYLQVIENDRLWDRVFVEVAQPVRVALTDQDAWRGFAAALPSDFALAAELDVDIRRGVVDRRGRVLQTSESLVGPPEVREVDGFFEATGPEDWEDCESTEPEVGDEQDPDAETGDDPADRCHRDRLQMRIGANDTVRIHLPALRDDILPASIRIAGAPLDDVDEVALELVAARGASEDPDQLHDADLLAVPRAAGLVVIGVTVNWTAPEGLGLRTTEGGALQIEDSGERDMIVQRNNDGEPPDDGLIVATVRGVSAEVSVGDLKARVEQRPWRTEGGCSQSAPTAPLAGLGLALLLVGASRRSRRARAC